MVSAPLIVGESRDLHIQAVVSELRTQPVILDSESLRTTALYMDSSGFTLADTPITATRGWLRRLAPPGWLESAEDPSIGGATRGSFLAVLSAVLRMPGVEWLTAVDSIGAVENKPVQYRLVQRSGCSVPEWLVTTNPRLAPSTGEWVAKPLGPGYFHTADGPRVVPVTEYDPEQQDYLEGAAFVLQKRVDATMHARVVTVHDRAYAAVLHNAGLPLDWRQDAHAHSSFVPFEDKSLCASAALAARACGVRFSSQDWIRDPLGKWWFVDLNPSGQWLFLPDAVSGPVTSNLASWLVGER